MGGREKQKQVVPRLKGTSRYKIIIKIQSHPYAFTFFLVTGPFCCCC